MATRPVYTQEAAISTHLRNIKLHQGVTLDSLAETASNEVDGLLGVRYVTPIIADPGDPEQRATSYWLQNVTSMLAAGRYLMAVAAPGSQTETNSYGKYLVSTAMTLINNVLNGKIDLIGVPEIDSGDGSDPAPMIINGDAFSQVDMFYENMAPGGFMPGAIPPQVGLPWPR